MVVVVDHLVEEAAVEAVSAVVVVSGMVAVEVEDFEEAAEEEAPEEDTMIMEVEETMVEDILAISIEMVVETASGQEAETISMEEEAVAADMKGAIDLGRGPRLEGLDAKSVGTESHQK